jgi:hypothetical protein
VATVVATKLNKEKAAAKDKAAAMAHIVKN